MARRSTRRGQALVMVTLVLVGMFAMMGLAVDLGWSYFVRKTAQAAADSAALAAVQAAFASASVTCGAVACTAPVNCPGAMLNLNNGCQYAARNGFTTAGAQTVTLEADLGSVRMPANVNYLTLEYWATARVRENIPQLFSAVLGNTTGNSGARATAAILNVEILGALMLLNRERDCLAWAGPNSVECGVNLQAGGNSTVRAKAGILMASQRHGDVSGIARDAAHYAGELSGSATVTADHTVIRGLGTANVSQTDPHWQVGWQNNQGDGPFFRDPMRDLAGQPPPPPSSGNNFPIAGCTIAGGVDFANRLLLSPGKYYSTAGGGGCRDGDPIAVQGYVEFQTGASGFGDYTFFGGLKTTTSTNITFNPGRYVLAGVKPRAGAAGALFDATSGQVTLTDQTPLVWNGSGWDSQPNADAGELFIFTDTAYPGLDKSGVPAGVLSELSFGTSGFQTGANNQVAINLHGLNDHAAQLPADLKSYFAPTADAVFQPVLFWQDQRNSVTRYYTAGGAKDMACIVGDAPCINALAHSNSPQLELQASPSVHFYGIVYQPRGAWTSLGGGGQYSGPLRIITGAIQFSGGADLDLVTLGTPLRVRTVALIE